MRDLNITTAAQLDAALLEQRAARIDQLRRQATWNLWANVLLIAAIAAQLITYLHERAAPILIQCIVLIGFAWLALWTTKKRKQRAARLV